MQRLGRAYFPLSDPGGDSRLQEVDPESVVTRGCEAGVQIDRGLRQLHSSWLNTRPRHKIAVNVGQSVMLQWTQFLFYLLYMCHILEMCCTHVNSEKALGIRYSEMSFRAHSYM